MRNFWCQFYSDHSLPRLASNSLSFKIYLIFLDAYESIQLRQLSKQDWEEHTSALANVNLFSSQVTVYNPEL